MRSRVRCEVIPMPECRFIGSRAQASGRLVAGCLRRRGGSELRAKPSVYWIELGILSEVDLQRRDRDVSARDRVEVGALARIGRIAGGADPVDRVAARVGGLDHALGLVAAA